MVFDCGGNGSYPNGTYPCGNGPCPGPDCGVVTPGTQHAGGQAEFYSLDNNPGRNGGFGYGGNGANNIGGGGGGGGGQYL